MHASEEVVLQLIKSKCVHVLYCMAVACIILPHLSIATQLPPLHGSFIRNKCNNTE